MKKALSHVSLAFIITGLAAFTLISCKFGNPTGVDIDECQNKMAVETDEYIKTGKISISGKSTEFFSNEEGQVYLLNSNELLDLQLKKSYQSTFAVIDFKDKSGKSIFYTLEQDVTPENITYNVKKDSALLQSVVVKLAFTAPEFDISSMPPSPPPTPVTWPPVNCQTLQNQANAAAAAALIQANQTCQKVRYCVNLCIPPNNPNTIAAVMYSVSPTSVACYVAIDNGTIAQKMVDPEWQRVGDNALVHQALNIALKKQGLLYKFSR